MKGNPSEIRTEDHVYVTMAVQTVLYQYRGQLHDVLAAPDTSLVKEMAHCIVLTAQKMKAITEAVLGERAIGDERLTR